MLPSLEPVRGKKKQPPTNPKKYPRAMSNQNKGELLLSKWEREMSNKVCSQEL